MTKKLGIILVFVGMLSGPAAAARTPEEICKASTWVNCGVAVRDALDQQRRTTDPKNVIALALMWGQAYDREYEALRRKGKIEASTPDAEKIFNEIKSHFDPVEITKDKAIDGLLKNYLPRVASIFEWAQKPVAVALRAFFDSSEIASDYDELRLMNHSIQQQVATLLAPFMVSDWRAKLEKATAQAAPQLIRP